MYTEYILKIFCFRFWDNNSFSVYFLISLYFIPLKTPLNPIKSTVTFSFSWRLPEWKWIVKSPGTTRGKNTVAEDEDKGDVSSGLIIGESVFHLNILNHLPSFHFGSPQLNQVWLQEVDFLRKWCFLEILWLGPLVQSSSLISCCTILQGYPWELQSPECV